MVGHTWSTTIIDETPETEFPISSAKIRIFLHICKKVWFKNTFLQNAYYEPVTMFSEKVEVQK